MKDCAELKDSSGASLRLYQFERFDDGSGYRMFVDMSSSPFSCKAKALYFENLEGIVRNLEEAHDSLNGSALFKFRYEDNELSIEYKSLGHVVVSLQLSDSSGEYQLVNLCFSTDQTYMSGFISQLKGVSVELHS